MVNDVTLSFLSGAALVLPSEVSQAGAAQFYDLMAVSYSHQLTVAVEHFASDHLIFSVASSVDGVQNRLVLPTVRLHLPRQSSRNTLYPSETPRCVSGIINASIQSDITRVSGIVVNSTCSLVSATSTESVCECHDSYGAGAAGVVYVQTACSALGTCADCNSVPGCGWCDDARYFETGLWSGAQCIDGNSAYSFFPAVCSTADNAWAYDSCPCEDYRGCDYCLTDAPRQSSNGVAERAKRQCGFCPGVTNDTDACIETSE